MTEGLKRKVLALRKRIYKTEVHKCKRERAMGERNTALAVAVERHMNLMWHNISKAVAMKLFSMQQPWFILRRESLIPV